MLPSLRCKFNSGVNSRIHKVCEQYAYNGKQCKEHIVTHDKGNVTLKHCLERLVTDTGEVEYLLGDDSTGEECGKKSRKACYKRNKCVSECVLINNDLFFNKMKFMKRSIYIEIKTIFNLYVVLTKCLSRNMQKHHARNFAYEPNIEFSFMEWK